MKTHNTLLMLIALLLSLGVLTACRDADEPEAAPQEAGDFKVLISVSQMTGEEILDSRAYNPMTPDRENSIRTLLVFQFDEEGSLRVLNKNNGGRYLFKKFTDLGDPNGIPRVTDDDMEELKRLRSDEMMHTCFLANVKESKIPEILFPDGLESPIKWQQFQEDVKLGLEFATPADIANDLTLEVGHLESTYMFGYYDGFVPSQGFTIGLGRLLTRLKVTFNATDADEDMKFYAAIRNLETSFYFSVTKDSPGNYYSDSAPQLLDKSRFDLATGKGVLQFYCAPHMGSRVTQSTATRLYLWCVAGDCDYVPTMAEEDLARAACIYLGADPLNDQYHLSRNTLYSFKVNLRLLR